MSKILKKSLLWLVLLTGVCVLTLGVQHGMQQASPALSAEQELVCCQQLGLVNPGLGLLYLAFVGKEHDTARWRRDFALALEKRRAKRTARLTGKNAPQRLSLTHKLLKTY